MTKVLQEDREVGCLCFFFTNYVAVARNQETSRGFLDLLLSLYSNVRHDSPLSLVTSALATNLTCIWTRRGPDSQLARTYHGRALALTKEAINDPQQNTTDQLLMTVLMLEFYERLSTATRFQSSSGAHRGGAVALVEHRGSLNFQSDTSKRLLIAVRHELITKALESGESISPNPAIWTNSPSMPESPAIALDALIVELANLKAFVDTARFPDPPSMLFDSPRSPSPGSFSASEASADILHSILAPALDLDSRFALWPKSLPIFWNPITVSSAACIPDSVAEAGMYGVACDIYPSLHVANLWNEYRTARISVLRIVLTCQRSLVHYPSSDDEDLVNDYAADTIQTLVDAFCASIPTHLGNKTKPVPPDRLVGVEFPHLPAQGESGLHGLPPSAIGYSAEMSKEEHYRLAAAIGGWYMLQPLRDILKATSPTAKDVEMGFPPLLRGGQTGWILAQLERLKNIYLLKFPSPTSK